ncbi:ATP-binding protein [Streptomyces coelicoflavus]|uniref:ATP-binding protein n=1 Tax=Streptomyces coelicoflavus TaxID=285562 RepID=A0A7K3PFK0_9ACTN|nr:ATP-binding protein [Streptomyces coelicoflavus]
MNRLDGTDRPTVLPETSTPGADLAAQFPSTPRGAHLARRHAVRWLEALGHPPESDVSCAVALVVGELAANAVQHGRVFGRTVGVRLTADAAAELVRVEVSDAAGDRRPSAAPPSSPPEGESGRGLLLVDVLALRWGWTPRKPLGKTVWAELPLKPAEGTTPDPGRR